MELIPQNIEILDPSSKKEWVKQMKKIEKAYRVCYQNEGSITEDSYASYIPKKLRHESPLEHVQITVELNCSRAIQQELTRHRLASFSIESTRWIDYIKKQGGSCVFIQPSDWSDLTEEQKAKYVEAMKSSEDYYNALRSLGLPAQRARDALCLGLKGKIIMSANVREWIHIFKLRTAKDAHPDIRQLTTMILMRFVDEAPPLFSHLMESYEDE
jgi:thymidylate synthase (FAD)